MCMCSLTLVLSFSFTHSHSSPRYSELHELWSRVSLSCLSAAASLTALVLDLHERFTAGYCGTDTVTVFQHDFWCLFCQDSSENERSSSSVSLNMRNIILVFLHFDILVVFLLSNTLQ